VVVLYLKYLHCIRLMTIRHYILFILLCSWTGTLQAQTINKATLINDIKTLSSETFAGRKPGSAGHEKAKAYLIDRFAEIGLRYFTADYTQQFPLNDRVNGYNIIGYIPGKYKETVVISAHYDHLGLRQDQLYL